MKIQDDEPKFKVLIYVSFIAFLLFIILFPLSFLPDHRPFYGFNITIIERKTPLPSNQPTVGPSSLNPTKNPTFNPTKNPTNNPTTTINPTVAPTKNLMSTRAPT